MGLLERWFGSERAVQFVLSDPRAGMGSPWATHPLAKVVIDDLMGIEAPDIGRGDLMQIPPYVRGRGLIVGTLGKYPLTLWEPNPADPSGDSDVQLPTPTWMTSTSLGQSPRMRMIGTLDDLIAYGLSVWAVERNSDNLVQDAARVQPENWDIDPDSLGVLVNGVPANDKEYVIIEGAQEGAVSLARNLALASKNLDAAWSDRTKTTAPVLTVKQTDANAQLDGDEVDDLVIDVETARRQHGTIPVPFGYELDELGAQAPTELFVQGDNKNRLNWANILQIPGTLLDGSTATASLTYSTQEGRRNEFVDYSLSFWTTPIEARLSQDDMTPPGTYARFDIRWLTNPTQAGLSPAQED